LGIDLDGVVADFTGGWIRLYNEEFGTELTREEVVRWHGVLDITHFASKHEFWTWARRGDRPSLFATLDPYDGALARLQDLAAEHEVVIITTKPSWAVHDTYAWIAEHRLPTREIHVTAQKWRVVCDVYLDDNPYQLHDIARNRPHATVCRYVRPWNRPGRDLVDIHDWDEFGDVVYRLSHSVRHGE
jgi:5'(3')-deoxyribonucleotidase